MKILVADKHLDLDRLDESRIISALELDFVDIVENEESYLVSLYPRLTRPSHCMVYPTGLKRDKREESILGYRSLPEIYVTGCEYEVDPANFSLNVRIGLVKNTDRVDIDADCLSKECLEELVGYKVDFSPAYDGSFGYVNMEELEEILYASKHCSTINITEILSCYNKFVLINPLLSIKIATDFILELLERIRKENLIFVYQAYRPIQRNEVYVASFVKLAENVNERFDASFILLDNTKARINFYVQSKQLKDCIIISNDHSVCNLQLDKVGILVRKDLIDEFFSA